MDATAVVADAVAWRRHLHRHPELSFQEHETAQFIRETLRSIEGLEVESPTETSVLARLTGARSGRTLALRADIDALPINEEADVEFGSETEGVMHACGHDGHTAMLLAVARTLATRRSELAGEVRFVFQHAEELPPGGASQLVESGALDGVDAVVGCHLLSMLELGRVAVLDGGCTAAADSFSVRIRGRGGHAAFPHDTVDPIAIAAQAIGNLQHVVARDTSPLESVVVSVTRIAGGNADNIIPEVVEFGGTVRTFNEDARERTRMTMIRILDGVCAAHDARHEFAFVRGYDAVINDVELSTLIRRTAGDRIVEMAPLMAGDDFSAYRHVSPICFFFVGAGGTDAFPHHHPRFTLDERALAVGIDTFTRAALDFLSEPR